MSEKQIKAKELIEDLNRKYLSTQEIGKRIGFTSRHTLCKIKSGLIEISDDSLKKLIALHEKIVHPKDISENYSRWDKLEKELDKKLGLT